MATDNNPRRIVILASGGGSNARAIMAHFQDHPTITVAAVITNKPNAGVLDVAAAFKVPGITLQRAAFKLTGRPDGRSEIGVLLDELNPDLVVLAGFLQLIPEDVVVRFRESVINIHPALLPRHGGKGMYGMNVHRAVLAAGDTHSGPTIHYVSER